MLLYFILELGDMIEPSNISVITELTVYIVRKTAHELNCESSAVETYSQNRKQLVWRIGWYDPFVKHKADTGQLTRKRVKIRDKKFELGVPHHTLQISMIKFMMQWYNVVLQACTITSEITHYI